MAITVQLELEDGSFTTRVLHAGETMDQFRKNVIGSNAALRQMAQSGQEVIRSMSRVDEAGRSSIGTFTRLSIITGGFTMAMGLAQRAMNGTLGDIIRVNAEYERLQVLMKSMGSSSGADLTKEAKKQTEALLAMSQRVPFSFTVLKESAVKLKSAGFDPLAGSLQAMTNAVAAFGGTDESLQRGILAITQMSGKGVIQMEELRQQLGEAIPRATELMARSMGVSMAELIKTVSTGTVESKAALNALFLELDRTFGNSATQMMTTFSGRLIQAQAGFQKLALNIGGGGFFDAVKQQLADLNTFLNSDLAANMAKQLGASLASGVEYLRAFFDTVVRFKSEIISLGQALLVVFATAKLVSWAGMAIGYIGTLRASWTALTGSIAMTEVATRSYLVQAAALRAWASIQGTLFATLHVQMLAFGQNLLRFAAFIPALVSGFVTFLPVIAAVGLALWGLASYFDVFGSKAKEALKNVREYGATSVEELKAAQEEAKRIADEADRLRNPRTKADAIRSANMPEGEKVAVQNNADQIERDMERRATEFYIGQAKERLEESKNAMAEELSALSRKYDAQRIAAQEQLRVDVDAARQRKASTKSIEDAYDKAKIADEKAFYDERALLYRKFIADYDKQIKRYANDPAMLKVLTEEKGEIVKALAESNENAERARRQAAGIVTTGIADDPVKAAKALETYYDAVAQKVADTKAELAGASGELAKFELEVKAGKYGDVEDPAVKKRIDEVRALVRAQEGFNKALKAQKDLDGIKDGLAEKYQKLRADVMGASGDLAEFNRQVAKGTYGNTEDPAIRAKINSTRELITALEELQEIQEAQKSFESDYENTIKKLREKRFEIETRNMTEAERYAARTKQNLDALNMPGSGVELVMEGLRRKIIEVRGTTDGFATALKDNLFGDQTQASGNSIVGILDRMLSKVLGITGAISNMRVPTISGMSFNGAPGGSAYTGGGSYVNALVGTESSGNPTATNPNSTATGLGQFIERTWLQFIEEMRPEFAAMSREYQLGLRNDAAISMQAIKWLTDKNASALIAADQQPTNANLYLAHFLGISDALKVLAAKASTPLNGLVDPRSMASNQFMMGMTAGDLQSWAARKMGNSAPYVGADELNRSTAAWDANTQAVVNNTTATATSDVAAEEAKTANASLKAAIEDLGGDYERLSVEADKAGDTVKAVREAIRRGEYGADRNPEADRYKELIALAEKYDQKVKMVADSEKAATDATNQLKDLTLQKEELIRRAKEANLATNKNTNFSASKQELDELIRKLNEYIATVKLAYGADSDEYRRAIAFKSQMLTQYQRTYTAEITKGLKNETDAMRRTTLSKSQQLDLQIADERAALAQQLKDVTLTEDQKVQIITASNEKIRQLQAQSMTGFQRQMQQWTDLSGQIDQLMTQTASSVSDALTSALMGEEVDWQAMLKQTISNLMKTGIQYIMGSIMGGGSKTAPVGKGTTTAGKGGKMAAPTFHTGGIVGSARSMMRSVHPGVFTNAPKFHTGGFVGGTGLSADEVPIIAKRGEGVFTPAQMKALGQGGAQNVSVSSSVTVNANGGSKEQNADLAEQVQKAVTSQVKNLVTSELRQQMKPRGMLNP